MKTRRNLQKLVGVLSIIVLLCLLAAVVCVGLIEIFPYSMPVGIKNTYNTIRYGVETAAISLGMGNLWYVLLIVTVVLPIQLLLIASILLLTRDSVKQGKFVAGSVLALIGVALLTIFTLVFAADLSVRGDAHIWYVAPFSWTNVDTIVRYAAGGLLAIFIIFTGSALGVKVKQNDAATQDVATQQTDTEIQEAADYETVAPSDEQQTTQQGTETTEFVPADDSVNDVVNGVYGNDVKQPSAAAMDKINKARMLYEMGAITQDEYIKLVNIYTKQ